MPLSDYRPPVAQLLTLGDPLIEQDGMSYRQLGLSEADVPELCRLAQAATLYDDEADDLQVYASVHAWRALGELRAEAAVDTLIGELHHAETDDWVAEELPAILGRIGAAAIAPLTTYLEDYDNDTWARFAAVSSLTAIARAFPANRDRCVAILSEQLTRFTEQDTDINALLIGELCTLAAVEAAPLMEQAFAADAVDMTVMGDWEDVQIELGLLERRLTPRPNYYGYGLPTPGASAPTLRKAAAGKTKKVKRKQQAKSRQRNRKKK
ncbi:DUF1186 domain-containing protein [Pseudomonas borbori]|uniref:HEAT repeat-containing protein n=1 Tax=Pseudomonas borbori TaxID=289003 RepID=A0A1I5UP07_9PSED|nr:DUF1186 domain-containing protein [Pseudomonas borbori]SFP96991.1 Protein of unknown function [Pseudomonas borbori]